MRLILFFWSLLFSLGLFAQDSDAQLAQIYLGKGEFDKALPYVERIFEREPSKVNFIRYFECLIETKNEKDAEKLVKKQIQNNREDSEYSIMLGELYEKQNENDKAEKIYEKLIDDLNSNPSRIVELFNSFRAKNKNDLARITLQKGDKLLKGTYPLQIQFADYYGAIGDNEKMFNSYLDLIEKFPNYLSYVQNMLARKIDFTEENSKSYDYLKTALLTKIQKTPDDETTNRMLIWLFVQRKNFQAALTQLIAYDKRKGDNGYSVFDLANMCLENKSYQTARSAFDYVRNLGSNSPLYYRSEAGYLNTRYLEITENQDYDSSQIAETIVNFKQTINRLGLRPATISMVQQLAHIEAFYGESADSALFHLEKALQTPSISDVQRAEIKMDLADILVLNGDIWEASLYYMQIDKDFKYETIGEEAKFKNSRIFYFDGEFDFAQAQLSILKEATSKLIANDAMRLSLLITENYGLDSNYEAMLWFAQGDLLIEQQQYQKAFTFFDSIQTKYETSPLGDEILLKKAEAMAKQRKWNEAIGFLNELLKFYAFDLLADDAVFMLGDIFENQLGDKEKAAEFYKKILFEHKGSIHTFEARKRFRALRGDKQPSEEEL